jgi:hypothetical protein
MNQPETYSVALALQDFMPVALSAIGLFYLAELADKMSGRTPLIKWFALVGAWVTMLGGGMKAAWKLNLALGGGNVVFLDNQLFFMLGAGFTLLAWAFITARRLHAGKNSIRYGWLVPLGIIAAHWLTALYLQSAYAETRYWFFVLLGLTTIANFTLSGVSIKQAFEQKQKLVAVFFILNILAILALQGLARTGDRSELMQWIEQLLNTFGTGVFAYAGYALNKKFGGK